MSLSGDESSSCILVPEGSSSWGVTGEIVPDLLGFIRWGTTLVDMAAVLCCLVTSSGV